MPWTARRSNQPILKEINPEYSLEGLMLKLKLQYLGHLMWKADLLEKTLMLGKIESRRRRGRQRMRWVDGIIASMDMSLRKLGNSEGQGRLACCSPWDCKESDTTESMTWAWYLLERDYCLYKKTWESLSFCSFPLLPSLSSSSFFSLPTM